jgi:hypothetical protein
MHDVCTIDKYLDLSKNRKYARNIVFYMPVMNNCFLMLLNHSNIDKTLTGFYYFDI